MTIYAPRNWRDEIITVPELAERLGVCERTITRRCQRRTIPATKVFGQYIIPAESLLELLKEDATRDLMMEDESEARERQCLLS